MQRPRHGGNLVWAAALAQCKPQELLDFSASINPLGPPASAIAAIQRGLNDIQHYPDPSYTQLRAVLAQQHQRQCQYLTPDWVLPGNGAAELLTLAGQALATQAITYILTPAFGDYRRAIVGSGGQCENIPIAELLQCSPELSGPIKLALPQQLLDNGPAPLTAPTSTPNRIGLLLNSPHNPSGGLLNIDSVRPYLEAGCLVVVDEAFMDFLRPAEQISLVPWLAQYPNLVVLRSLTKFYSLPGLRLGYALGQPELLQQWQRWRDPWSVNVLAEAAGLAVLQDTDFQRQTWDWLPQARDQLLTGLRQLPGLQPYPGAANFLLVESDFSVTALQTQLLQRSRILIRDCLSFPELGDRFFRVAVRTTAENQQLLTGLNDIVQ
ncbi:MAG: threonine-phosphate decarboxylase CobD [Cyanobacteria bacterium P01_H01_bin.121]